MSRFHHGFHVTRSQEARAVGLLRVGVALLALTLFALVLPSAWAFTDGQAASLVLGQSNFTTSTAVTSARGMNLPYGVAVDLTTGKVFVADSSNNRVLRFAAGTTLTNGDAAEAVFGQPDFTTKTPTTTATGMNSSFGVAVDNSGTLWVSDAGNSRVLRFDNAATKASGAAADGVLGQTSFTTKAAATTAMGMNSPTGVAVDSNGILWVVDFLNSRVLRFDSAATKPNGAAADGVLGQTSFTTKAAATTAMGMYVPVGGAVDRSGTLWVGDQGNHRVLRFDNAATKPNGAAADGVLGQPDFTTKTILTSASGMYLPEGVAVDRHGRLFVADSYNSRVLRFDNAATKPNGAAADGVLGQSDFTTKTAATSANGMIFPTGVAVDSSDSLWVADNNNSRVLRFDVPTPAITWDNPTAITYGTPLSATQLNATASFNGQPVMGTLVYSPTVGTVLPAGAGQVLAVTFTPDDTAQFAVVSSQQLLDVNKATLAVAADDKTGIVGQPLPSLTASITGFVNGETASVLAGAPVCTTTATTSSPAGNYPITCTIGTLVVANYTFTFTPGTLIRLPSTALQPRIYLPMLVQEPLTRFTAAR